MIIRELPDDIVMIAQHDHAKISGILADNLKDRLFKDIDLSKNVKLAATEHDRAWIPLDKYPFWNDQTEKPFSFMDFPGPPKLVFYKQGIDEIEQLDPYAAMLCSHHYIRFAENDSSPEAKKFIEWELLRQMKIRNELTDYSEDKFNDHYKLLAFTDTLSLFICLNEPGFSRKAQRKGKLSEMDCPDPSSASRLKAGWHEPDHIELSSFPFQHVFEVNWRQKSVPKKDIAKNGIISAYQEAPFEEQIVTIKAMSQVN